MPPSALPRSIAGQDLVELRLVHDRADLDVGVGRVADLAALDPCEQPCSEVVVDLVLDVDPRVAVHFWPADQNAPA